jgi:hypothetical protein
MNSLEVDSLGLRINSDIAFTTHKNKPRRRTMNLQLKLLRPLAPMLKQLLAKDEEILLAARACSPMSWFEQATTGWIVMYLKRCVLVVTNKRILHFPARHNYAPKKSVAQILYRDIAEAKLRGFLGCVLTLRYKSGKKESFNYVMRAEFTKLKTLLPGLANQGEPSEVGERHHLCPRCQARLVKGKFTCPDCHLTFKDGDQALKLSILYPGGGYFYTRHPFLGIGDALTEGILLIMVIAGLIDWLTGEGGEEAWVSVVAFGTVLIIEKLQTIYHAKHYVNEYIPLDDNFVPAAVAS